MPESIGGFDPSRRRTTPLVITVITAYADNLHLFDLCQSASLSVCCVFLAATTSGFFPCF
jgi:hypothetical protein